MGTLVAFHAHPDDECLTTGGTLARASAEGHRVVLVVATNGDHGEAPEDLATGETVVDRRRAETERSGAALGVHRVVWLGYRDSGMSGWEQNADPSSFLQAPLDEAARRLAEILGDERADVLLTYDWHGNYGHPDHVKVHAVGHRAADLAGTPAVFEATMNRDEMVRWMEVEGMGPDFDPRQPMDDGNPLGSSEDEITLCVDVSAYTAHKRASIACHASQVTDTAMFLEMTDDVFAGAFRREWFIERGAPPGMRHGFVLSH
jgi:LmbE family N-acetylglucosaminyl deacetylase